MKNYHTIIIPLLTLTSIVALSNLIEDNSSTLFQTVLLSIPITIGFYVNARLAQKIKQWHFPKMLLSMLVLIISVSIFCYGLGESSLLGAYLMLLIGSPICWLLFAFLMRRLFKIQIVPALPYMLIAYFITTGIIFWWLSVTNISQSDSLMINLPLAVVISIVFPLAIPDKNHTSYQP